MSKTSKDLNEKARPEQIRWFRGGTGRVVTSIVVSVYAIVVMVLQLIVWLPSERAAFETWMTGVVAVMVAILLVLSITNLVAALRFRKVRRFIKDRFHESGWRIELHDGWYMSYEGTLASGTLTYGVDRGRDTSGSRSQSHSSFVYRIEGNFISAEQRWSIQNGPAVSSGSWYNAPKSALGELMHQLRDADNRAVTTA